ncbi:isochorismatase family cysteine hydrolase [Afipia sp. P52-10]|uniref:cysteine hydrolase family protein n=1 Tax=Afipia sp. P52-10 TaxID=1429916 RepID=UPI0031B8ABBA
MSFVLPLNRLGARDLQPIATNAAVHLCLDMQAMFGPDGPWPTPWMERVLPNVVRISEALAERTVFTRFIPPAHADDMPGRWRDFYRKWQVVTRERIDPSCLRLVPELERFIPPAKLFDKTVYSAFADGRLALRLADRRVNTLIVTGAETDVCVLSTVMSAVDYGFRTVLITDAVCSSSDEGHDALMQMYSRRLDIQIELAGTREAIEALAG